MHTLAYIVVGGLAAMAQAKTPTPQLRFQESARVQPRALSDVFLITIDTLRADHVGCYGDRDIRTPALDGLANDGIRFANAFTPSPITNTSHASILTGLLPTTHGVTDFGMPIAPSTRTLAQMMKERGYVTAAFIGSVVLDSKALAPGFDRGFDYYDNFPAHLPKTVSRYVRVERRGREVVQRAEKWLSQHGDARRKFVWVHLYDPHDPYDPPPPYDREYAGRLYDGEVAYADSALARFFEFLRKQHVYERSLIVVVGDHGEGLGEHGEQTHGIFLYDATTRVPLIIKLPRLASRPNPRPINPRGLVLAAQVRTLDIFPTVLELEGIKSTDHLDGASLCALWSSQQVPAGSRDSAANPTSVPLERVVFGETDYPIRFGWASLRSVRAGGGKYIEAPRPEFYDLRTDPNETKNRYEPWNKTLQNLRAMLAELRNRNVSVSAEASAVGPQTIDELKALGYLETNSKSTRGGQPSLLADPKDKIEVYNFIHSAMIAREEGDISAARKALENALTMDPKSAVVLIQLGKLELDQGNYKRAADLLGRSRQVRPEDARTALDEARARYACGDLVGARDALEANVQAGGNHYDRLSLLGKIYAALRDWDKAQDQFEVAVSLNPNKPEARVELARVLLAQNHPAAALLQLRQASRLSPNSPEVFDLMSQAYSQEGDKAEAQRTARRAETLKSRRPQPERRKSSPAPAEK